VSETGGGGGGPGDKPPGDEPPGAPPAPDVDAGWPTVPDAWPQPPVPPQPVSFLPPAPPPPLEPLPFSDSAPGAGPADLVEAVGARLPRKERKKRDKDLDKLVEQAEVEAAEEALDPVERAERKGRRKMMVVLALTIALGLLITAFAILGRLNKDRFFIACGATEIRAEQGRGFPPWGSSPIDGAEWKPIAIPPNAECHAHEVDSIADLTDEYLAALVEQAQVRLTAKDVTEVDLAAQQLEQALLLSRDPKRRDPRKEIERLLGDVEYWRATARLRAAIGTLGEAAKQFDVAATRRPHHVGDAAAWAELARRAATALGAGPNGQTTAPPVPGEPTRVPPPFGVALPVETPDAAPAPAAEVTPDAGLPSGGVLL
jgi:hypothetical protein